MPAPTREAGRIHRPNVATHRWQGVFSRRGAAASRRVESSVAKSGDASRAWWNDPSRLAEVILGRFGSRVVRVPAVLARVATRARAVSSARSPVPRVKLETQNVRTQASAASYSCGIRTACHRSFSGSEPDGERCSRNRSGRLSLHRSSRVDRLASQCVDDFGRDGASHGTLVNGAKIFASGYALFAGLFFVAMAGVLLGPFLHRLMHHFHVEDSKDKSQ